MMPSTKAKKPVKSRSADTPKPELLEVDGIAAMLDVSTDTVYDLLKSGALPALKIGRKWKTTPGAVMRWVEESMTAATRDRTIGSGDRRALTKLLQSSAVRVKG